MPKNPLLLVPLWFLALYVCLTWPLVLHPATRIVANNGDGPFDMLLFWYARHGQMLAPRVDTLCYPDGVALGVEKMYWLVPGLSVPFQLFMPVPLIFNLLGAAFFVATGASIWLLAREQGAGDAGGILAGTLLVTSPAYLNEMSQGIPENMALQWPVLFVLYGMRAARTPSAGWACATFYVLSWMTSWYVGVLATLLLPWLPLRSLFPRFLVVVPLLAWALLPLWKVTRDFEERYDSAILQQMASLPDPPRTAGESGGALLDMTDRDWRQQATDAVVRNSSDYSGFFARYRPYHMRDTLPGLLLLGLACIGLSRPRQGLPWGLLALLFFMLAQGPVLIWRGHPSVGTPFTFAYEWLPALSHMRPSRWQLGLALSLAMLAAYSVPRLQSRKLRAGAVALLIVLQCCEGWWVLQAHYRVQLVSAEVPAGYEALRGSGPMIEYPIVPNNLANGLHLFAQTVHGNPLFNYDFITLSALRRLQKLGQDNSMIALLLRDSGKVRRADAQKLAAEGFRSLVLHARVPRGADNALFGPELLETLRALYGEPRALDGGLLVFDLAAPRDIWDAGGNYEADPPFERLQNPTLSAAEPVSLGTVKRGEVRGWLRHGRVVLRRQGQIVAQSESQDDDWTFVRLPQTGEIEVWIEPSSAEAQYARFGVLTER